MCGIAGIYNFRTDRPVDPSVIEAMCDRMRHRGPDGHGVFTNGSIGLGHRRLSIIDVNERSNQPMHSSDGRLTITYNGEVYNYRELAAPLEAAGCIFRTESDTEVLLNLYDRDGPDCLKHLNGMFGFAIWNAAEKTLFLARDRLGIKPLYYCLTADGIVFASEVKSILAALPDRPRLTENAIDAFMSFGYVPGEQTMFSGIMKLPPGTCISIVDGKVTRRKYWDFQFDRTDEFSAREYQEKVIDLLRDATRLRLRSDVPLGVFLSGGVDSSAVVAMMRELHANPIKTFSVRWDQGKQYDESNYARLVSDMFGTEHHEYTMTEDDFVTFLPRFQYLMDEPVTEAAAISLYYIAAQATKEVTVILSGEGADEVFGGYPIYRYLQLVELYKKLPNALREFAFDPLLSRLHRKFKKYVTMSRTSIENCYFGVSVYDNESKLSVYSPDMLELSLGNSAAKHVAEFFQPTRDLELFSRMQYLDVKTWLVDDLLIKADRMSMAASMELRVPFLDHRFLELSGTIPSKYLASAWESKKLLKNALEPYLPKKILYRKKQGFPTPVSNLLRGRLGELARDSFSSRRFSQRGYFDQATVTGLLDDHMSGKRDHHRILWQLLVFELWCNEFMD